MSDGGLRGPQRIVAITCVLAAIVLVVLDASVTNLALPAIAEAWNITPAATVRVVTAYQLALVMTLLPAAALGETFGYRRVYTAGIAIFMGASALCVSATSLSALLIARFAQGIGSAAIMSLSVALLRRIVSQQQLGAAVAWNTLAVATASATGPSFAALVLSHWSWPWLFAVSLPLGLLVLSATRALPESTRTVAPLDLVSMLLNTAAFAALIFGMELLTERAGLGACLLAAGILTMSWLVRRELPKRSPLLPLDLLRQGSFRISVIASVCGFIGQSAAFIALPFYLQRGLGQDVLQTGLLMTAWPVTVALSAPVAGRLADRVSGAWLCASGAALLSLGLVLAAWWPVNGQPAVMLPFFALSGAGFGQFQVSNNSNMFSSAARSRSAAAGGAQSMARLIGQTLGAVTMTGLFTLTSTELAPRLGLSLAALMTLTAGLISTLRVSDARLAA